MYLNYVNRRCWKIYWSDGVTARRKRVEAASHHSLRPPWTQREATSNPGHDSRPTWETAKGDIVPETCYLRTVKEGTLAWQKLYQVTVFWKKLVALKTGKKAPGPDKHFINNTRENFVVISLTETQPWKRMGGRCDVRVWVLVWEW